MRTKDWVKGIVGVCVCGAALSLSAAECFVTATGVDDADHGGSWDSAYKTIPYAINQVKGAATADDPATVWVDDGFVHEAATDGTVTVPKYVTLRSKSGDWKTGATIHGVLNYVPTAAMSDPAVKRCVNLNANATIIGFNLLGGGGGNGTNNNGGIDGGNRTTSVARNCRIAYCWGYGSASVQKATLYDCLITCCTNSKNQTASPYQCDLYDCTISGMKTQAGVQGTLDCKAWRCTFENNAQLGNNSEAYDSTFRGNAVSSVFVAKASSAALANTAYVERCVFTNNTKSCVNCGGGYSSLKAKDCTFAKNRAEASEGSCLELLNCPIYQNHITTTGNSMSLLGAGVISNCVIHSNTGDSTVASTSYFYGGIRYGNGEATKFIKCTITNNWFTWNGERSKASKRRGCVAYNAGTSVTLIDCYIANNGSGTYALDGGNLYNTVVLDNDADYQFSAASRHAMVNSSVIRTSGSGTTYSNSSADASPTNCVFWNGASCGDSGKFIPVNCCTARATSDPTKASFNADPQLNMDPTSSTFLMPLKGSPCIDQSKGDCDFAWMRDPADVRSKDIYGDDRVVGTYADLGAIEYFDPSAVTHPLTVSGTPRAYGQAVPEYGSMEYETGDFTYELAGGETVDDTTWYVTAAGDARANFVSVTYQSGASAAETLTEFPFTRPLNAATTVTWAFANEEYRARATVSAPFYGRVSVAGADFAEESAAWVTKNGSVTFAASTTHPEAAFVQWTGPSASLLTPAQRTSPTIIVTASEPIDLVAEFSGPYVPTVVKTGTGTWNGYPCDNYKVDGYTACVVRPSKAIFPAGERPWTWTMKWWEAFVPESGVPDLVGRGYYHTWIDTFAGRCRTDEELAILNGWQLWVVNEYKLLPKARLIGMSWGGFYCGRYAATYPDNVLRIYFDNPLLTFKEFTGSPEITKAWEDEKPASGDWNDDPRMPVNHAADIAAAGIPVLMYRSTADKTVVPEWNSELFAARFQQAGGDYREVVREGADHHPHGRTDDNDLRILKFMTGVDAEGSFYVSEGGSDAASGGDWAHAFRTIAYAMSWAKSGDTIWVDDGYVHEVATGGTVTVPAGVTLRSRSGDWRTGATIHGVLTKVPGQKEGMTGGSAVRCVNLNAGGTIIGFDLVGGGGGSGTSDIGGIAGGNRATSVAENCRITGCWGYSYASVEKATLTNCVVSCNTNSNVGCAGPNNCNLYRCTVVSNIAQRGNCSSLYDSVARKCTFGWNNGQVVQRSSVYDSTFTRHGSTSIMGGATSDDTSTAVHCIFTNNTGTCVGGSVTATDCEFVGNRAVSAQRNTFVDCKVHHNVIDTTGNTMVLLGGGFYTNCVIHSNSGDCTNASYCYGGIRYLSNTSSEDTEFVKCTITNNWFTWNGEKSKASKRRGCVFYSAGGIHVTMIDCYVANNGSGDYALQDANFYNTVVLDNDANVQVSASTKHAMVNSSVIRTSGSGKTFSNSSADAAATNCVFWNGAACGDSGSFTPVNCCSARYESDPTGRSFNTDPQLNVDPAAGFLLMPLKGSPCIDQCTDDCAFGWMTDKADIRSKDVYKHKRVFGDAADIGAIEYWLPPGLAIIVR